MKLEWSSLNSSIRKVIELPVRARACVCMCVSRTHDEGRVVLGAHCPVQSGDAIFCPEIQMSPPALQHLDELCTALQLGRQCQGAFCNRPHTHTHTHTHNAYSMKNYGHQMIILLRKQYDNWWGKSVAKVFRPLVVEWALKQDETEGACHSDNIWVNS